MPDHDALPTISASQRTSLVEQLLAQIEQLLEANCRQAEQIQRVRDEIAIPTRRSRNQTGRVDYRSG